MEHGGKRTGAGRPKGQGRYGTTTTAIRVPDYLVEDVKDYSVNGGYKIPLFSSYVEAGYPSVAEDHIEDMLDMNNLLIKNPKTTFCVRVTGLSMIEAGIYEGDKLIVDSSITPIEGKIVVAAIDGMLTVKRLGYIDGRPFLLPENLNFDPIPILENSEVHIWGVVTNILRSV
ncbi:MAG: translesion error-prone DNA polymerase V autoproteolytic subunit [Rickettsiales bacterium]|nr:translesion error-prone DNA polymerase V autoproteolytic subunit [Rickettsiales bacterium]MCA0254437.1 translesion error-prone DNA polymerase V autoproteolytic subunit [Pseudomonadota bacterium]